MSVGLRRRLERLEEASGQGVTKYVFLRDGEATPEVPDGTKLVVISWQQSHGHAQV